MSYEGGDCGKEQMKKAVEKALASIGVAVVLYALSIGPVWRFTRGFEKRPSISGFYTPLLWLCLQSKPMNDAANWYLGLWYEFRQSD